MNVLSFEMGAFEELMTNPTKTAIWSEIFRRPGITAKELIEILDFKKTKTYYTLKEMLDSGLIEAETVTVKQSLNLKKYRITKEFEKILKNKEILLNKPREMKLFYLFTILALLKVEIRKTLNSTNEELQALRSKIIEANRIPSGISVIQYSMDREQQLLHDFKEFVEAKISKDLREVIDSEVYKKNFGTFFFGFVSSD